MLLNILLSFSIFGDFTDIDLSNEKQNSKYKNLANEFVQNAMIVGVGKEVIIQFNPQKNAVPMQKTVLRPSIFSSNGEWLINFASNRIDINWNAKNDSSRIDSEEFIEKAYLFLDIIERSYEITYNRIAFNSEDIYYNFDEEKAKSIFKKTSNTNLSLYKDKDLKQWVLQLAISERPQDFTTDVNIVTSIQRTIKNLPWIKNIDSISVHYDCNTIFDEKNKITKMEVKSFLNNYVKWRDKFNKEIFEN